ncbi:hypothetical protein LVJ82_06650 [Vitreoscilla massiliensis]|uniref:Uncharacterized protein n=1 Tax=Vitreoscilla massiliensis TaxID=1689272 RepID=A0ABY4E4H6_9NEIS|nr:hypothetical protein [Vitreoscilla massiliensis]UOO90646.1 hypothetical protein LVJ82_06650 [Vitreoscilla massiliensis]
MIRSWVMVGLLLWQQMALAEELDAAWRQLAVPAPLASTWQKLQQTAKLPARAEFRARAQAQLRAFTWAAQTPALQQDLATRTQRYPAPKYRMLSAQTLTERRIGNVPFSVRMSHQLQPLPNGQATLWQMQVLSRMGGERFRTEAEAIYHPAMGLVSTWMDSSEHSEISTTLSQQQVDYLADGSLPRHYRESSVTAYRYLWDVPSTERSSTGECSASEPYAATRIHPNIKGRAQSVQCLTRPNDHAVNTIDMVYLLDYQVFVPTWQHYLEGDWQWRMLAFQGT